MTDQEILSQYLDPLGLSGWQFHSVVGSTNDLALTWAKEGAEDWSLVLADSQTAGRGRGAREWETKPGTSLALSLVLRPSPLEVAYFPRFTALAALGLIRALAGLGLDGEIKWPNDILLQKKKVAGVLVEADWRGSLLQALVVGLGVNITPDAVPNPERLRYPAISVTSAAGKPVDRWALLAEILTAMMDLRSLVTDDEFVEAWNRHLAFRNELIGFQFSEGDVRPVTVLGMAGDGRLSLKEADGKIRHVVTGEIVVSDQSSEKDPHQH